MSQWLTCFDNDSYIKYSADFYNQHSVESPSIVDPRWDILYWGSKRNLHTVCWDAVGCEWETTSVYFRITYVCFIPSRLPVFAVEPRYQYRGFLFLLKVSFEGHIQNRYIVLRVQEKFAHSLLRCGWLWVGDNLCLLSNYLCLFYP